MFSTLPTFFLVQDPIGLFFWGGEGGRRVAEVIPLVKNIRLD